MLCQGRQSCRDYDDYINTVKTRFATGPRKASNATKKTTP